MNFEFAVVYGFGIFNFMRAVFYIPQIIELAKLEKVCDSHSKQNWFIRIGANATMGGSYWSATHCFDSGVYLCLLNALMCSIILGVLIYKAKKYGTVCMVEGGAEND